MQEPVRDSYTVGRRALAGLLGVQLTCRDERVPYASLQPTVDLGSATEMMGRTERATTAFADADSSPRLNELPLRRPERTSLGAGEYGVPGVSVPLTGGGVTTLQREISLVSTTAEGIIQVYRGSNTVSTREFQLLRIHAERAIALARVNAIGEIARAVLQEIITTSREVETMEPNLLPYGMRILEDMNRQMRRMLDDF